jgi:hypothetical protein
MVSTGGLLSGFAAHHDVEACHCLLASLAISVWTACAIYSTAFAAFMASCGLASQERNQKEKSMSLDKIIVLLFALLFFAGATLLYLKNQRDEKRGGKTPSPSNPDRIEGDSSNKSQ